jgi:nucleoside phosphorylase
MIVVTGCFRREIKWVEPRPGLRIVRTRMGEASAADLEARSRKGLEPALLISTGFCGGLDPGMRIGDVFLARTILHRGETLPISGALVDRARGALDELALSVWTGPCACVDAVAGADEKRELVKTGAKSVDLESGPLARWAAARGVPFLSCRVVLDSAEVEMPFSGPGPLWWTMLRHLRATLALYRGSTLAGRQVGRAVAAVADALGEAVE